MRASIADLGEEHGHRVLCVRGKGGTVVLVLLPLAVARAIDRAVDGHTGAIVRNTFGACSQSESRPAALARR